MLTSLHKRDETIPAPQTLELTKSHAGQAGFRIAIDTDILVAGTPHNALAGRTMTLDLHDIQECLLEELGMQVGLQWIWCKSMNFWAGSIGELIIDAFYLYMICNMINMIHDTISWHWLPGKPNRILMLKYIICTLLSHHAAHCSWSGISTVALKTWPWHYNPCSSHLISFHHWTMAG